MHPIHAFSDGFVDRFAAHRPVLATFWGVAGHDHRWPDLSPAGVAAFATFLADERTTLDALPPASDRWDVLAVDIARATIDVEQQILASGAPYRALSHIASPFQLFHMALTHMHRTGAAPDALRARLRGLDEAFAGYREALRHGLDHGHPVAARQVRSCIAQGRSLLAERLLDGPELPEVAEAYAAYASFTDWLEETVLPRAPERDGVGEDAYRVAVRTFLHTDPDLDGTFAWGWTRVVELHAAIQEVLGRLALPDLATAVRTLQTAEHATAPDADAFLDRVRHWQANALQALDGLVPTPPIARNLRIERAPRGLPPGAWYLPPDEHGTRPGIVQYSLGDDRIPLFDQQSTAFHEGFPGHHLQLALQTTLQSRLSRLHRVVFHCTGFSEGWALYAEQLCDEQELYDDDVQRLGYLVNQIARAARVVLDIGLHTGRPMPVVGLPERVGDRPTGYTPGARFDFDRAVAFLTTIGGLRPEVSESEITRYLGWPGQAISYAVGQRALLEHRERFLASGGTLLGFHEHVLGSGTVPLARLGSDRR
jgi:uncharacterized protein (DUF885 family)